MSTNGLRLKKCGIKSTSLSYRTKDIKCPDVNGKCQHFLQLKMRLQLALTRHFF